MARDGYIKLSGRSTFSVQKAYLGEDHLLIVDGVYREKSKRIFYKDIEAILICPTKSGAVLSMLAGLGSALFTILTLANLQNDSFVFWLIAALVSGATFARGIHQKGSVAFGLQTAVQTIVLHGLGSRRKASRALPQLVERIEARQGRLSTEALQAAQLAQRSATASATPPPFQKNGKAADNEIAGRER